MKLNLSNTYDLAKFEARCKVLVSKGSKVDLTEFREGRTIQQNKYCHVLFKLYGIEIGLSLAEAKTDLKRECPFMRYEKNEKQYLKHTSKLDTKELTDFIDWIRTYAGKNGIILPTPEQYRENRFEIDKEIERNKEYL